MARAFEPRAGSSAHIAICHIVHLGGTATFQQISPNLTPSHQARANFDSVVIRPLMDFGFITRDGRYTLKATEKGKEYAGRFLCNSLPRHVEYVGAIAPSRTFNPRRELDVAKRRAVAPYRPGSDEYRNIPSLMGAQRKLPSGEVI